MDRILLLFLILLFYFASLYGQWEIENEGIPSNLSAVEFINEQIGWIASKNILYRTEDGGKSWSSFLLIEDWCIEQIDFVDESTGWAIISKCEDLDWGDRMLVKSIDGGQSWTIQIERLSPLTQLSAVNESILYMLVGDILYESLDGGINWLDIYPNNMGTLRIKSIWFFDQTNGLVFGNEMNTNSAIILRTYDGGNSWTTKTDSNFREFYDIDFVDESTGFFKAADQNGGTYICFTSDTCNSWVVKGEIPFEITNIEAVDNDRIYTFIDTVSREKHLLLSNDGGISWEIQDAPDTWTYQNIYFYDSNFGLLFSSIGNQGWGSGYPGYLISKNNNSGNDWSISNISYPLKDIYFPNREIGFISGGISEWHGGSGHLFKTEDGGETWISSYQSQDQVKSVFFTNPQIGYILSNHRESGTVLNILKTTNSGNTWEEVYGDVSDSSGFYFAGKEVYFMNENSGWVAGAGFDDDSSGAAFLSTENGGDSWDVHWIEMDSEMYRYALNSLHFVDQITGWAVGEFGLIAKYTDSNSWERKTIDTDIPLKDVYFSDKNHGWISGGYYDEDNVNLQLFRTDDGGQNWLKISTAEYQINDMFFKDSLHGWAVGNDTSFHGDWQSPSKCGVVLETIDGGLNWSVQKEGLIAPLTAIHFKDGYGWAAGQLGLLLRYDGVNWIDDRKISVDVPQRFELSQNYPNPFNPRTIINYELPITNVVDLSIYNLVGQKVATLVSGQQNAGYHQVEWNASGFASGVYYFRIEAGEFVDVKKMILIR